MSRTWSRTRVASVHLCLLAVALASVPAQAAIESSFSPYAFQLNACSLAPASDILPSDLFCPWVAMLIADQISTGCAAGRYCPDGPLTRAQAAMMLEKAMRGTANWDPWRGDYRRTLIVNAVGTPAQNGAMLLARLAEIVGASATNYYLVKVEPGTFDLGITGAATKSYVDVEGSGEGVTLITSAFSAVALNVADHSEVRNLTVRNTGGASNSIAVSLSSGSSRLVHVTALASGGSGQNRGVDVTSSGTILDHLTASASASGGATAIGLRIGANATVRWSTLKASGGNLAIGIQSIAGASTLFWVEASATAADPSYAISAVTGASLDLDGVRAQAATIAAGATGAGLHLLDGDATVAGSLLQATAANSYGVLAQQSSGSHSVRVRSSKLLAAAHTVLGDSGYTIQIGASQMAGGAASPGGATLTCFGVYDEDFANGGGVNSCP